MAELRLAELIGSLSHALDLTEGQPAGHCVRCCWIGMHVGQRLGLGEEELWSLYYALLLKDLGCSSNAACICELYLTDDREFKRDFKKIGSGGTPQMLAFVFSHTGPHAGWRRRLGAIANIVRNGDAIAQELIQTRCSRGADIARQLRFPESVATHEWAAVQRHATYTGQILGRISQLAELAQVAAAHHERLDGAGYPRGLTAKDITLETRIITVADIFDAISSERPYHPPMDADRTLGIMRAGVGPAIDPECFAALERVVVA